MTQAERARHGACNETCRSVLPVCDDLCTFAKLDSSENNLMVQNRTGLSPSSMTTSANRK